MKHEEIAMLAAEVGPVVRELLDKATGPLISRIAALEKQIADAPTPRDGKDGARGEKGEAGADGKDGAPGENGAPGRDGLDVADLFKADGGRLIAVLSDGRTKDLGQFVGKDGAPGRDGLGFDDMTLEADEHGRPVAKFSRGDETKSITLAGVYRGVYKAEDDYRKGDSVTFGGSLWTALEDTADRPDGGKGWQLSVKKGRDGKDGEMKAPPEPKPVKVG
jgi:hypothetical protein